MKRGFSLVELSIVLVILGLLTGGILAGQSLIRAAELRAVSTEYGRWATASQTFRDKYFALPGDFRDATRFWNRLNTGADCASRHGLAAAGTPGACDGDGNGALGNPVNASESGEVYQFWRHLQLAGLIEGTYTGIAGSGASWHVTNGNAPRGRVGNSLWSVLNHGAQDGTNIWYYDMTYGMMLLNSAPVANNWPLIGIMAPEELWNIDIKMDDGVPGRGNVIAGAKNTCTLAGSATDYSAGYNLISTSKTACAPVFRNIF